MSRDVPTGKQRTRAVLALIGGVLMGLGALLPWESVNSQLVGLKSANGMQEGAGPIVLVAGIVVVLLAAFFLTGRIGRRSSIATLVLSVVAVVFAFGNFSAGISDDIDRAKKAGVDASIGFGLIIAIVGCLLAAVVSALLLRRAGTQTSEASPAGDGKQGAPVNPEGWYPDPLHRHPDRWWDGAAWTMWVRDKPGGTRSEDPLPT
jgi:hypothetical protein